MKTMLSQKEQILASFALLLVGLVPFSAVAEDFDFGRDIRPILSDACYDCHGPDVKARKAKLAMLVPMPIAWHALMWPMARLTWRAWFWARIYRPIMRRLRLPPRSLSIRC